VGKEGRYRNVFICQNCIGVSPLARFVHHSTFTPNARSHRLRIPSARGAGNWLPISPGALGEDILFPFAMCLNTYFSTAWMQPLNLWAYAGTDGLGTPRAPVRLPAAARLEP
jgi:hypothetical protein